MKNISQSRVRTPQRLLYMIAAAVLAVPTTHGAEDPHSPGRLAPKPLYRDPVFDGAAAPVVIWNPHVGRWWMFYTNRRANVTNAPGVAWVHGTRLGIAESADHGATWQYVGTAAIELPKEIAGDAPTHWAPEVITAPDGTHHMSARQLGGTAWSWP